ncbi:MAG TPA: alcohol dehydrogenase catalytic domain-containing protein [Candidatus Binataceae bacterium]|nr:alcohol dehydrogenase catalytic domain-containing protein [Candidatus Binataceae bacterium]
MRACVYRAPGAPLELAELPDPIAGPGELVIRVKACGICGSDLHAAGRNFRMPAGTVMGHEFSGVIETIGEGVEGFERGEPVVAMSCVGCGGCDRCRAGEAQRCREVKLVGFGEVAGAYAELMKTRPASVFKMPAGMSFKQAATVEPLVVGLHGLHRADLKAGESCVVMGAGPIGLTTMLWARFAGARAIVVSEPNEHRRRLALKMGADAAVDPRMHNPSGRVEALTGAGPQVIFECVGAPGAIAEATAYAQPGGRIAIVGVCTEEDAFPPLIAMRKELDLRFSLGMERAEIEMALAALAAGRIATAPMITHTMPLDALPRAFASLQLPTNQCKVMVEF